MRDPHNERLRRDWLRDRLNDREATVIELEDIISSDLWPDSAAFPSYWYGVQPGARLAFKMGYKVAYSSKYMTVTFNPISSVEIKAMHARIERAKQGYIERNGRIREHLNKFRQGAEIDDLTDCGDDRESGEDLADGEV